MSIWFLFQKELCAADVVVFGAVYPLLQEKAFQGDDAVVLFVVYSTVVRMLCHVNRMVMLWQSTHCCQRKLLYSDDAGHHVFECHTHV